MARQKGQRSRHTAPVRLENATRFSDDDEDLNVLAVMRAVKQRKDIWDDVQTQLAELSSKFGPDRIEGDWPLMYVGFTFSREADVKPFWKQAGHSLWRCAGFAKRPSYATCNRRFAELEPFEHVFRAAAAKLIQRAVKNSGGLVGRDVHIDGTEAESHARLIHICGPEHDCRRRGKSANSGTFEKFGGTRVTANVPTDTVQELRHREHAKQDPESVDPEKLNVGEADDVERDHKGRLIVTLRGCRYLVCDPTAGVRAYVRKSENGVVVRRFWVGNYNIKGIDHYTGAPLACVVTSASVNEGKSYEPVMEQVQEHTGITPRSVVADRGYNQKSVFEYNTRRGISSVIAYKRVRGITERADEDRDAYDRHGVPRCKHCGAPGRYRRFSHTDPRGPRIWFTCSLPATEECQQDQTIMCKENWRMLVPLWRTNATYLALRKTHMQYERVHDHWRTRYRVGCDNHKQRPKRRQGQPCQQLRASAALLIEWLIICWREGWLDSPRRNQGVDIVEDYSAAADGFTISRLRAGLLSRYGAYARKLDKKAPKRPIKRERAPQAPPPAPPPDDPLLTSDVPF